jgi:hypothetical protein
MLLSALGLGSSVSDKTVFDRKEPEKNAIRAGETLPSIKGNDYQAFAVFICRAIHHVFRCFSIPVMLLSALGLGSSVSLLYSAFSNVFADFIFFIAAFAFHCIVSLLSSLLLLLPPPIEFGFALKAKLASRPGLATKVCVMLLLFIFNPCSCSVIDSATGYPIAPSLKPNKLPSSLLSSYCESALSEPTFGGRKRSKADVEEETFYLGIIKKSCKCASPCLQAYVKDGNYKPMIELVKHCRNALNSASSKGERDNFIRQLHHSAVRTTNENLLNPVSTPPKSLLYSWKIGPPSHQLNVNNFIWCVDFFDFTFFLGLSSCCLRRIWV